MNFHRRMLMQNLGAGALGLTLAAMASPAMAEEDVKVVPLSDRRPFREGETKKDEAWVRYCENCRP